MKGKIIFSVVLVALYLMAQSVWGVFAPMVRGSLGVHQLEDSIPASAVALAGSNTDVISSVLSLIVLLVLILVWRNQIWSSIKRAYTWMKES